MSGKSGRGKSRKGEGKRKGKGKRQRASLSFDEQFELCRKTTQETFGDLEPHETSKCAKLDEFLAEVKSYQVALRKKQETLRKIKDAEELTKELKETPWFNEKLSDEHRTSVIELMRDFAVEVWDPEVDELEADPHPGTLRGVKLRISVKGSYASIFSGHISYIKGDDDCSEVRETLTKNLELPALVIKQWVSTLIPIIARRKEPDEDMLADLIKTWEREFCES